MFTLHQKMDLKATPNDRKVFGYVCDNFSCQICDNILIQCVTLSCGHNFCHYCLDLYAGGKGANHHHCPQCNHPIQHVHPNGNIDQKIDHLLSQCSSQIQQAYATALDLRFRKAVERSKMRNGHNSNNMDSKMGNLLDGICSSLKGKYNGNMSLEQNMARAQKSAGASRVQVQMPSSTLRKGHPSVESAKSQQLQNNGTHQSSRSSRGEHKKRNSTTSSEDIDMDKVNTLFGIYEHVLRSDNEPNKEMAGGDFLREQEQVKQEMENPPQIDIAGMTNFSKRSQTELESLIKEADDIIKLDGHVQKWSKKMRDALTGSGGGERGERTTESENFGMRDEKFDSKLHSVDDKLWKASKELLNRLQNMRNKGQSLQKSKDLESRIITPLIPPPARSPMLDFGSISDDSDVEEYEQSLRSLHICLNDSHQDQTMGIGDGGVDTKKKDESSEMIQLGKRRTATESPAVAAVITRKKSMSDVVEESGNEYVKENIEFITHMRKYKEALLKIHNREVETAQEIKELLPTPTRPFRTSSSDTPDSAEHAQMVEPRGGLASRSSHPNFSQSAHHMRPHSRSGVPRNHQSIPRSTRMSARVVPPPLSRPMTATPYEISSHLQSPRQFQRQAGQGQSKHCNMGRSRLTKNPLYTVR